MHVQEFPQYGYVHILIIRAFTLVGRFDLGKRLLLVVIILLFLCTAAWADKACVVLNVVDQAGCRAAVSAVSAAGGRVHHVFSPSVLICDLDLSAEQAVKQLPSVQDVLHAPVDIAAYPGLSPLSRVGLNAWNFLISSKLSVSSLDDSIPTLSDEVRIAPDTMQTGVLFTSSLSDSSPGFYDTSDFMIGSVTVGIILPESAGNAENWSSDRIDSVIKKIVQGMDWWVSKSAGAARLTVYYDAPSSNLGVTCTSEPISLASYQIYGWMTEVMNKLGYTGSDCFAMVRSYINSIRKSYGTDWSFCVFVVDSFNDSDGSFSDGTSSFAYLSGPMVVMTYDCGAWGHSMMDQMVWHEIGHIFGASDEYCTGYSCCDFSFYGYLNVKNSNCANTNSQSVPCVMKDCSDNLCIYTMQQIGWWDTDGDGIFDPVDTDVACSLNAYTSDPTSDHQLKYSGIAVDQPCDSLTFTPVTINSISDVEYRVDNGSWFTASAADGAFDSPYEIFSFTTPKLAAGKHTITVRARNCVGNTSSEVTDSVTITPDTTPPVNLKVRDDGLYTNSTCTLRAGWSADDPESGIGGYAYAVGTLPSDPGKGYLLNWTIAGLKTSVCISSQLKAGETYYFYVKSANMDGYWSAAAASDGITVKPSVPIGSIKSLSDGAKVTLEYKTVTTALSDGVFYIEDDSRSSGIRAASDTTVQSGNRITLTGTLRSTSSGERYIEVNNLQLICKNENLPSPLGISILNLGNTLFNPVNSETSTYGLCNIGLLVRTCGAVASTDAGCFYIKQGRYDTLVKVISDRSVKIGQIIIVSGVTSLAITQDTNQPIPIIFATEVN